MTITICEACKGECSSVYHEDTWYPPMRVCESCHIELWDRMSAVKSQWLFDMKNRKHDDKR
jgi:hypothetical protein